MENGEAVQDAAAREARKKPLPTWKSARSLAIVNVIRAHQVHIMFRARLRNTNFGVGPESLEVRSTTKRTFRGPTSPF